MTSAQKERLLDATKTDFGLQIPLGPWLLALGLREADAKLGTDQHGLNSPKPSEVLKALASSPARKGRRVRF
jgi:hypothetical protein